MDVEKKKPTTQPRMLNNAQKNTKLPKPGLLVLYGTENLRMKYS